MIARLISPHVSWTMSSVKNVSVEFCALMKKLRFQNMDPKIPRSVTLSLSLASPVPYSCHFLVCSMASIHTHVPINTLLLPLCLVDSYASFQAQRGVFWTLGKFQFLC